MRSAIGRPSPLRALRFENLEDRIVLSGRGVADFCLDQSLLTQPSDVFEQVEAATPLAEVHDQFGVTYARNTFGFTGTGQTVVVIDSGVAYDHVALGGGLGPNYRVVGGWDFTEENDALPYDDGPAGFHGTHVAGIIGSDAPDHLGVAPGVDLVALRVFNDQGIGYFEWVEQALGWVHQHRTDFAHPITTVTLSLGVNWNSDQTPTWTTLEDELAQLNRDGIFVAVAAGNGFQAYQTAGLSYPAASPYVVPVASVADDGSLSSFSQRNSRVLAAPGEQITSTVPDYLYSFDGVTNDYAAATGTSMAAPYVAGASVLVREAFQFSGQTLVTQAMIYDLLGETADSVFDAATGQSYRRINLQSALDAIMPADEYGSTAGTAFSWGTLSADATATGIIGQLDDVDYFRFTAGVSGVATFSVTTAGELAPELLGAGVRAGDGTLTFDVVAERQYVVGIGSEAGIGNYETRVEIVPQIVDLGVVEVLEFADAASGNDPWYRFTAARDGLLTVEVSWDRLPHNVSVRLYDGRGNLVAEGSPSDGKAQLEFTATSGARYAMTLTGDGGPANLRITNVFQGIDGPLEITTGDVTGDGLSDVLGRTQRGHLWLARQTEAGFVTQYAGQWSGRGIWEDVLVKDLTGDGRTDVLSCTVTGQWWIAVNSETGFVNRYAGNWSTDLDWHDVMFRDFTGDGRNDVLARNEEGGWWLAKSAGLGYRSESWGHWSENTTWSDVLPGDFTGDGLPDVVGRSASGRWYLAVNNGRRLVTRLQGAWSPSADWSDVMTGDFTGDGRLDIVGRTGSGRWYVAENTGGRFVNRLWGAWSTSTTWSDVMVGDLSGDGLADIVGRTSTGRWYLAENTGSEFLNRSWGAWSTETAWSDVMIGDFTGDGLIDVAGLAASGNWYVARNSGTGSVNQLWDAWNARGVASETPASDAGQTSPLQTASVSHDLDRWLATPEGRRAMISLLHASDSQAGWPDAIDRYFATDSTASNA